MNIGMYRSSCGRSFSDTRFRNCEISLCKFGVIFLVLAMLFLVTGCATKGLSPLSELEVKPGQENEYRVQQGDTLNIQIWGETRLSGEQVVRADGRLTLPLINDVQAEGMSLSELAADIENKLSAFVTTPKVTISVVQESATRYYLSGTFTKPGEYRSMGKISFLQAIATGGGFAPFADEDSVILIRKRNNQDVRYQLNYSRVIEGLQPNPVLMSGDIIAVK